MEPSSIANICGSFTAFGSFTTSKTDELPHLPLVASQKLPWLLITEKLIAQLC